MYFINPGLSENCLHKFHPSVKLLGSVGCGWVFSTFSSRGMLSRADAGIRADPTVLAGGAAAAGFFETEARESQPREPGGEGRSYSCERPLGTEPPLRDSQVPALPRYRPKTCVRVCNVFLQKAF